MYTVPARITSTDVAACAAEALMRQASDAHGYDPADTLSPFGFNISYCGQPGTERSELRPPASV